MSGIVGIDNASRKYVFVDKEDINGPKVEEKGYHKGASKDSDLS